jgi:hypothetical protein
MGRRVRRHNPSDDILGCQYRRHRNNLIERRLNLYRLVLVQLCGVIPEIDIWRAANLMLKRYGEKALEESAERADEFAAAAGHHDGADTWRRIHGGRRAACQEHAAWTAALSPKSGSPAGCFST